MDLPRPPGPTTTRPPPRPKPRNGRSTVTGRSILGVPSPFMASVPSPLPASADVSPTPRSGSSTNSMTRSFPGGSPAAPTPSTPTSAGRSSRGMSVSGSRTNGGRTRAAVSSGTSASARWLCSVNPPTRSASSSLMRSPPRPARRRQRCPGKSRTCSGWSCIPAWALRGHSLRPTERGWSG